MRLPRFLPVITTLLLASATACKSEDPKASAPPASPSDQAALEKAKAAGGKLGQAVRGRLLEALTQGGPEKAVAICATEAQEIARKVHEETGASVGRSSLRLRNPADAPPPWVGEWLKAQGERKAEGAPGIHAVVATPEGRVARFLKPIEIEATCLLCHGDPASLPAKVKETLAEKYPGDKATGYAAGDLRGALWAEVKVE